MFNKETIRNIIENTDTFWGKVFTFTVQSLIVISLITFSIDTLPDLSVGIKNILNIIEVITVGVFTLEYMLRIMIYKKS